MVDTAGKGNKRKRNTGGSSNASKKVAFERDRDVTISLHAGDGWAPIIASTPGISLPAAITLKSYTKPHGNGPQNSARAGPIARPELLLHSSAHPKLDYTAREEEAGRADSLLNHYVGVYDPETGKLEVMEARKMVVRGSVRAQQATAEDQGSTSMKELRNNLGQAFGTKKAKKAIASVTDNAISTAKSTRGDQPVKLDAAAAAMIASMAKDTEGMATRDQLAAEANASKPRPKANLDATDITDVYTIESLIGTDMIVHVPVMDWQQKLKAGKEVLVRSRFVANRIKKLSLNLEKLKMLRYLLLLLDFHSTSKSQRGGSKALPKRDELKKALGGMPEAVVESVKRRFSTAGIMSKYQVDLLITHVCALACVVDNYEVDTFDLMEDLRLEAKQMSQYFHEIGAKIGALPEGTRKQLGLDKAAAAQRKVAKLKLPLDFPRVAFARRAR